MASAEIVPLAPDDVEELSTFLTQGFQVPPDCDYFTRGLAWKYFESCGNGDEPRSFISREEGRIIGHFGLCPRSFEAAGKPGLAVPTAIGIDWFVSPGHRGVGLCLMLKAMPHMGTLYSIGGSGMALPVLKAMKFEAWQPVPGYRRILRPLRRLHDGSSSVGFRLARLARRHFPGGAASAPAAAPRAHAPRALAEVGPEINQILASGPPDVLCTTRTPQLLNYFLRYPHAPVTAWGLCEGGEAARLRPVADDAHQQAAAGKDHRVLRRLRAIRACGMPRTRPPWITSTTRRPIT